MWVFCISSGLYMIVGELKIFGMFEIVLIYSCLSMAAGPDNNPLPQAWGRLGGLPEAQTPSLARRYLKRSLKKSSPYTIYYISTISEVIRMKMKMPQFKFPSVPACCCFDLKTGCIIIGILGLVCALCCEWRGCGLTCLYPDWVCPGGAGLRRGGGGHHVWSPGVD